MKVSQNFVLQELVNPEVFNEFGELSIWFIDTKMIAVIEKVRALVREEDNDAVILINNWHKGGQFRDSGYRDPNAKIGAFRSQHKLGKAFDLKVLGGLTNKRLYEIILENKAELISLGLTTLEDIAMTATWVHIDCRYTGLENEFLIVKP